MPEKIFTCLTCPAMTARVTPAPLRILMHLPRWPSDTQWKVGAGVPGCRLEVGKCLFLDPDDGDIVAEAAGALQDQERKPAVAGNQSNGGHDSVCRGAGSPPSLGPSRQTTICFQGATPDRRAGSNVSLSEGPGGLGLWRLTGKIGRYARALVSGEKMFRSTVVFLSRAALVALALFAAACDNGPRLTPRSDARSRDGNLYRNHHAERRDQHPFDGIERRE